MYTYIHNSLLHLFSLQLVQIANTILTISQATASNGRSCTELLTLILSGQLDNTEDEVKSHRVYVLCTYSYVYHPYIEYIDSEGLFTLLNRSIVEWSDSCEHAIYV